jgi:L-aspartate oxidase
MLTKAARPEESNTWYAQGGIIYRGTEDSPEQLASDIIAAGDGLCDPAAVALLAREGPRLVDEVLIGDANVVFDHADGRPGALDLTAEAAHSMARIVHHADTTGRSIEEAMLARVAREPGIELLTGQTAIDLLTLSHHSQNALDVYAPPTCVGAYVFDQATRRVETVMARETILATGGLGRIFLHTSNPAGSCGDGVAMAYRAGARCINMQFVQFHPTTLYVGDERFLISESLRGEGARLVDDRGREFMLDYHPDGSLAPRDVVARGIHQMMHETGAPCAYLDISHKSAAWVRTRFPRIHDRCREAGIDIIAQPIPVVPAAHYSCGGVAVDEWGRSSLLRLRAVGEVSCTGLHGANRLASTSLLECLVWGTRAGEDAAAAIAKADAYYLPGIAPWQHETELVDPALVAQDWLTIRQTMWNYVGLVRTRKRLDRAHQILRELHLEIGRFYAQSELGDALVGLRNGIQTALVVLLAAMEARTSAGCHYRID